MKLVVCIQFWFVLLIIAACSTARATNYYLSNAGSDSNNGTSSSTPWATATPLNSVGTFSPGDTINLLGSSTFTAAGSQFVLAGSGTGWGAGQFITLQSYGGGTATIQGSSGINDRPVTITNPSYWMIQNIAVANAGDGLKVRWNSLGNTGLHVIGCTFSNILGVVNSIPSTSDSIEYSTAIDMENGSGITVPPTSSQWMIKDVLISGCSVDSSVVTTASKCLYDDSGVGVEGPYGFQNVVFSGNSFTNISVCGTIVDTFGFTYLGNYLHNVATIGLPQGTTGFFFWQAGNGFVANNIFSSVANTSSSDQCVIDQEAYCDSISYFGNYFYSAPGASMEFLQLTAGSDPPRDPSTDHNTNTLLTGNVFDLTNLAGLTDSESGNIPTGAYAGNIFYLPGLVLFGGNSNSGFSNSLNMQLSSSGGLYNAGFTFSGTQNVNQWSYQRSGGSSWSNIPIYSESQWQTGSGGYVAQMSLLPDPAASHQVAYVWTAPTTGNVFIRGRVLKQDNAGGDGVIATIIKNTTPIWGPQAIGATDQVGYNTNLDFIPVTAGDVIRFEINCGSSGDNTHDLTSWMPTVSYPGTFGTQASAP